MIGRTAFAVAKAGLVSLTRSAAVEWAARGVRVNAIAPGFIATEGVQEAVRRGIVDLEVALSRTPMRRMGRPVEIANAVEMSMRGVRDPAAWTPESGWLPRGTWFSSRSPSPDIAVGEQLWQHTVRLVLELLVGIMARARSVPACGRGRERAMRDFEGKVALVTGGASGIGKSVASQLARGRARVALVDLPNSAGADVAKEIRAEGGDVRFVGADVAQAEDCERIVADTVAAFGRLDMALNNAGALAFGRRVADEDLATWDRAQSVNLRGVFLCMKYELRQMLANGGGSIVNTSSVSGVVGTQNLAIYTATKHGVVGLTRAAALEYARDNIRINALCPGGTDTPMLRSMLDTVNIDALCPMGRLAHPDELARSAVFLLSDGASYITGQALVVDGGVTA